MPAPVRLRRIQAFRQLRQYEEEEDEAEASGVHMCENKSPIQLKRMLSEAYAVYGEAIPPIPPKSALRTEKEVTAGRSLSVHDDQLDSKTATDGSYHNELRHHHKNPAVLLLIDQLDLKPHQWPDNDLDSTVRSPSNAHSVETASSTIRFNARCPYLHQAECTCDTCRQIRHQRRKISLKLAARLETCRKIMITIRDPEDPSDPERGKAYGHWLKLARLYVRYETLAEVEVNDYCEEDVLFTHYIQAFRALEKLVEDEKVAWGHLFGEQYIGCARLDSARLVDVSSCERQEDPVTSYGIEAEAEARTPD